MMQNNVQKYLKMIKHIKILTAIVAAVLLAGCDMEEHDGGQTLPVEGRFGVAVSSGLENQEATKAGEDFQEPSRVVVEAYRLTSGGVIGETAVYDETFISDGDLASGKTAMAKLQEAVIRLVPGQYMFCFWADYDSKKARYTADNLTEVTKTNEEIANPDAFCTAVTIDYGGKDGTQINATLKRPFGVLELTSSQTPADGSTLIVKYKEYNSYNVATGASSGTATEKRFDITSITSASAFHTGYLFPLKSGETLAIQYGIRETSLTTINIPVEANRKTTVTGDFTAIL